MDSTATIVPLKPRLRGDLDWLTFSRFFAAIWVVFAHVGIPTSHLPGPVQACLYRFSAHGSLGVTFFFLLSGFILTHVYGEKKSVGYRNFLVARFARIYPVYLFALVLAVPMLIAQSKEHLANHGHAIGAAVVAIKAAMVLTLTQAWLPSSALFWNGVAWTLSAEAFFYFLFPVLLPRLKKASTPTLIWIMVACLLVEIGRISGGSHHPSLSWSVLPALRLGNFITGISLRILMDRNLKLPFWTAIPSSILLVGLQSLPDESNAWNMGILVGTHALLLCLITSLAQPRPTAIHGPSMRLPILLGQISYSMYLLHYPFHEIWNVLFSSDPPRGPSVTYYAVLFLVCWGSYSWIEAPAREWIRTSAARPG